MDRRWFRACARCGRTSGALNRFHCPFVRGQHPFGVCRVSPTYGLCGSCVRLHMAELHPGWTLVLKRGIHYGTRRATFFAVGNGFAVEKYEEQLWPGGPTVKGWKLVQER